MDNRVFATVIVGAGPAGIAVLLAACRNGTLEKFLNEGVAIVEAKKYFGAGQIGDYAINSDSTALTFIDCIKNNPFPEFAFLQNHPLTLKFAAADQNAIALGLVGEMSLLIGEALRRLITNHPACAVYLDSKVLSASKEPGGSWRSRVALPNGRKTELVSRNLIIATGGHQPRSRLATETISGQSLTEFCGNRLIQSGEVLRTGGLKSVARRLAGKPNPKIVVLGGSTSAVAVAHTLLNRLQPQLATINAVSLLHRQALRIYYPSIAEALADGYSDFTQDDLCPLTNRVFRFAGLRLDSKDLVRQALRIGGRQPDPRLRLHHLQSRDPEALQMIAGADLVIACFGYRPRALKLADSYGRAIKLHTATSVRAPLVDEYCRVLDAQCRPLKNLFAIGLASGFMPRGIFGGEPSFSGQANGLWLWQTAVGGLIVDQILATQKVETARQLNIPKDAPLMFPSQTGISHIAELSGD